MIEHYNYPVFNAAEVERWLRFEHSPPLGERVPDFTLYDLDAGRETRLSEVWSSFLYTIVEFGSFT
jgi:hypothetical protein